MDALLFSLALLGFVVWVPSTLEMLVGFRFVPLLREYEPLAAPECPRLSIVVPACNEADTVEPAMRSLLALDYPDYEVIAVEDRSTDETGRILDGLALEDPRLRVLHVTELPPGWLGKNHALQRGSEAASGEWLLFTDADVLYAPDALRRVMAAVHARPCDHIVAMPRILVEGFWERAFVGYFMTMFSFRFRTWQASWKRGWGYVGVGAFSMVRTAAYREMGGHGALPMEVADDIKLGKLIKRSGYRQQMVEAAELIRVRWLIGLRGAVDGLTKNAFAGVGYSWMAVVMCAAGMMIGAVWPWIGLWVGPPAVRLLCLLTLLAKPLAAWAQKRGSGIPVRYSAVWPLCALIFIYIIVRSGLLAERQGGIYWRGTFYPLEKLRRGMV